MATPGSPAATEAVMTVATGPQAHERIRADIVFGVLAPAQRLVLDRLRPVYGVGIGTLREIFCGLVPEGLVVAEGQRGFQVAPCSGEDLRDVAQLRLLLEAEALRLSFREADMEWEGRCVAAHHKLARMEERLIAGRETSPQQWKRYDFEFHHALLSACGSKALLQLHAGIYDRYLRYQMVFGLFRGAPAADEHRRLLECALERDAEGALVILQQHVDACVDLLLADGLTRAQARR